MGEVMDVRDHEKGESDVRKPNVQEMGYRFGWRRAEMKIRHGGRVIMSRVSIARRSR
jgi:hypothetical protein